MPAGRQHWPQFRLLTARRCQPVQRQCCRCSRRWAAQWSCLLLLPPVQGRAGLCWAAPAQGNARARQRFCRRKRAAVKMLVRPGGAHRAAVPTVSTTAPQSAPAFTTAVFSYLAAQTLRNAPRKKHSLTTNANKLCCLLAYSRAGQQRGVLVLQGSSNRQ